MTSKRKPPATEADLVRGAADLFARVEPGPEETDEILRSARLDPALVRSHMGAAARRAMAKSPFNWRNKAEELERARSRLGQVKPRRFANRNARLAAVQWLVSRGGGPAQQVVGAYRNFETQTEEDLDSLIDELEALTGEEAPITDQDQE